MSEVTARIAALEELVGQLHAKIQLPHRLREQEIRDQIDRVNRFTVSGHAADDFGAAAAAQAAAIAASQPLDPTLTAIAGVTTAANKGIYFTGIDTAAAFDLTAAGLAILDDADADAQLATLGGVAPTGAGAIVRKSSPTLITPALGVASATSVDASSGFKVAGTQVVGAQQAAISDATSSIDIIPKFNTLLAELRSHGMIAT